MSTTALSRTKPGLIAAAWARVLSSQGRDKPPRPSMPARRKSRRVRPSQSWLVEPLRSVSMGDPLMLLARTTGGVLGTRGSEQPFTGDLRVKPRVESAQPVVGVAQTVVLTTPTGHNPWWPQPSVIELKLLRVD